MAVGTRFRIASLTKPMVAALTLDLVRNGLLSLNDPISRRLPEAAEPRVLVARDAPIEPLGMSSTAFFAPTGLATAYLPDGSVLDPPNGLYAAPLQFPKLAGGVVSPLGGSTERWPTAARRSSRRTN